ncbi:von Willebrand factor A domain-containing protein 7-like isoform X2 [Crassostrea virginica]
MSPLWQGFLLCCLLCNTTLGFPPNAIQGEDKTQSHFSLTLSAVFQSTAAFLVQYKLVNNTGKPPSQIVQEYFGTDQESYSNYIGIIRRIIGYENNIQKDFANIAFYHVNGEQIELAHNHIRSLRQNIKTLSNTTSDAILEEIREKIGAAIYTIQEFYSNTNWIELNGPVVYKEFGQENVTLEEIADPQDDTCADCAYLEGLELCDNNIQGGKLTSGYKSGQDVTKPIRQGLTGKCSHGSSDDETRYDTATGGIYKGRSVETEAPHYRLHGEASDAALDATEYFLIGEERGLLSLVGEEVFRDVFGIRTREDVVHTSLTFVIDVTGSMGDDIQAVITATQRIVTEAKDSNFVPENYVLVTFSDPASLTNGRMTTDPQEMLTWLKGLSVSGGGDCAEYAMSGMLLGIQKSNPKSKIYLCTDADAKDEERADEVTAALKAKELTPIYLLTGQCSRRKRDSGSHLQRVKRSSLQVFQRIAEETGGRVYETTVTALETIVETEIRDTFPSSNVLITWFVFPANSQPLENISLPVDSHIESLKIVVTGVTAIRGEFDLFYPNGSSVLFLSGDELKNLLKDVLTLSIKNPIAGTWVLLRNTARAWTVNVTAQSQIDFSTSILVRGKGYDSYMLTGNPLRGFNYSIVVDIQNESTNISCDNIVLLDDERQEVAEIPVTRRGIQEITSCVGSYTPILKSSYVQINGTDEFGNRYLRTQVFTILPASIELRIQPVSGDLRMNEQTNISFSLTNTGDSTEDFIVTISKGKESVDVQTGRLEAGQVYNAVVGVTPDSLNSILLEFSVTLKNYTGVVQLETRRYSVTDTRTADCTVINYPPMCPIDSLNSVNCSSYNWTGLVEVSSSTIRLSTIVVSTDEVIIEHDKITTANFSLPILIRGDCCVQSVLISILDKDGYFDRCRFQLSNEPFLIVQTTTATMTTNHPSVEPQEGISLMLIGIVVGSILAAVIVLVVAAVLIYKAKSNRRHDDILPLQ